MNNALTHLAAQPANDTRPEHPAVREHRLAVLARIEAERAARLAADPWR